jgi:hypothetical protein
MLNYEDFKQSVLESVLTESTPVKLGPADKGILAAVLDDNKHLGDDDIVDELKYAVIHNDIAPTKDAYMVAYKFFREATDKKRK